MSATPVPLRQPLSGKNQQGSYSPPSDATQLANNVTVVGVAISGIEPATGGTIQPTLPAGIAAGDLIYVCVAVAGATVNPTLTTANGFAALTASGANGGTAGGTTAASGIIPLYTTKTAAGGDVGPVITLANSANRGAVAFAVVLRSTTASHSAITTGVGPFSDLATTSPLFSVSGQTKPTQRGIAFVAWDGAGSNFAGGSPTFSTPGTAGDILTDTGYTGTQRNPVSVAGIAGHSGLSYLMNSVSVAGPTVTLPQSSNYATFFIVTEENTYQDTAPESPTVTPGQTTKGAWVQLIASTTFDAKAIRLCFDGEPTVQPNPVPTFWADIGVGGAGSEVVVIADIHVKYPLMGTSANTYDKMWIELPVSIPAGSRVAVRMRQRTNTGGAPRATSAVHATLLN